MYRVLIVDDEQLMREALSIMISKVEGFQVMYCVSNGKKAFQICKNEIIDIIFMDIMMPEETGIETSKKILKLNPNITIFILSAYNNFEFAREALKIKVREYILKPVSYSEIKVILDNYKEYYKTSNKQYEILFSIIKEKDFKKMYYSIPQIVYELYLSVENDKEKLKNVFRRLGESLINSIEWFDSDTKKRCEELFPLTEVIFSERKCLEFWLFKVMNFVFIQFSINKYPLLKSVLEYIDKNIKSDIGLNEIIEKCSVSQGYLSRIFKQQMNVSVMEYIHMKKMILAKTFFSFTELSIADVSFRLGYNESSYFCKVFKKYEHMTIFQYKKMITTKNGFNL